MARELAREGVHRVLSRVVEGGFPTLVVVLDAEELPEERIAELLSSGRVRRLYIFKGIICSGGDYCSEFTCELLDCSAAEELAELLERDDVILIVIHYGRERDCTLRYAIVAAEVEGGREEALEELQRELGGRRGVRLAIRRDELASDIMWFIRNQYEFNCMEK